jgi:GT2 family glycosyltransferase
MLMPITAIVTACARVDHLLQTLTALEGCEPAPAEILVHVDGRNAACEAAVRRAHSRVRVMVSERIVGPGGGRNLLLAAATHPIVASFDDDSRPIDRDYFARLAEVIDRVPDAAVVGAAVYHRHETVAEATRAAAWTADFAGGACAYRRERFLESGGYVPLETASGMEEVDLALRLHAQGWRVLHTPWLRVFHDTDLARHADPRVTAASIANLALLAYLRYPITMWVVGAGQIVNRIRWLLGHGRRRGVMSGLARIPSTLRSHRGYRHTVPASAVRSYLRLRRNPVVVPLGDA